MQYQGYYGSIEASTADNRLYGKLLFIRPLVSYEGRTVAALQAAFHAIWRPASSRAALPRCPARVRSMCGWGTIYTWQQCSRRRGRT